MQRLIVMVCAVTIPEFAANIHSNGINSVPRNYENAVTASEQRSNGTTRTQKMAFLHPLDLFFKYTEICPDSFC